MKTKSIYNTGLLLFIVRIIAKAFGFITVILITKYVRPEQYAAYSMSWSIVSLSMAFSELGMKQAYINSIRDNISIVSTYRTIEIIRGLALCIVMVILSGPLENYLSIENLQSILLILCVVPLLKSLGSVGIIESQKQMIFRPIISLDIIAIITTLFLVIPSILFFKSIHYFSIAIVISELIKLIASYIIAPRYPKLNIDMETLKGLWNYGKWILLSSLFAYLAIESDTWYVASFFSAEELGLYSL